MWLPEKRLFRRRVVNPAPVFLDIAGSEHAEIRGYFIKDNQTFFDIHFRNRDIQFFRKHFEHLTFDILRGLLDRLTGHQRLAAGIGPEIDAEIRIAGFQPYPFQRNSQRLGGDHGKRRIRALPDFGGCRINQRGSAVFRKLDHHRTVIGVGAVDGKARTGNEESAGHADPLASWEFAFFFFHSDVSLTASIHSLMPRLLMLRSLQVTSPVTIMRLGAEAPTHVRFYHADFPHGQSQHHRDGALDIMRNLSRGIQGECSGMVIIGDTSLRLDKCAVLAFVYQRGRPDKVAFLECRFDITELLMHFGAEIAGISLQALFRGNRSQMGQADTAHDNPGGFNDPGGIILAIPSDSAISPTVTQEPIFNPPAEKSSCFISAIREMETRCFGDINFFFMSTSRSVPPARSFAFSPYSAFI